jgi:uncharacterized protein YndB with AHSA1/START domain
MPDATEPLRHELQIAAPPEVVFAYFTDPVRMVEWMGLAALLDPRPGGALRIDANGRDVVVGEYLELEPPRRLVFTWGFDGDGRATGAGSSRVEVVLEPEGGDGTRLTLSHHDLPPSARPSHAQGWEHYLERLGRAAAGDPPGRDPWLPAT